MSTMRDGWTETTLGEIITLEYGKPLKAENRDGNGFPVFGSAGEVGLHSEPLVNEAPVIVVGRKGTAGAVWWSDLPCSVIDTAYYVVQKIETDIRFLYFTMGFLDLPSLNAQTGVPGLNRDRAYSTQVLLPPPAEQKRIVDVVSYVDAYIDALQQQVDTARAARNAVLHELIVLPSKHRKKMEDFVFLKRGHDLPTQSRIDGEFPVIASNGTVGWHNERIGPIPGVITGRSGTIGKVLFATGGYWPLNTTLYVTEFMGNDERFAALTLETMRLERFAGGSTVPSLDRKVLRNELVFAPPIEEQKRIVEIVSSMDGVIQSTEQAVVDAKNLRSGLLSGLLSGEHEIPASYDSLLGAA